uniref:Uncharacterized protein n=1 Tax=Anopheles atroparvus TaxID=41427 RepID=A0AAG5DEC4_ANOAO
MNYQRSRTNLILCTSFSAMLVLCAVFTPVLGETETSEGFFAQLWDSIFGSKQSVTSNETIVKNETVSESVLTTTELSIRSTSDNETFSDLTATPVLSSTGPKITSDLEGGSSSSTPRSNKSDQTDKEVSSSTTTILSTKFAASSVTTDITNSDTTITNSGDFVGNASTMASIGISTAGDAVLTTNVSPKKTG